MARTPARAGTGAGHGRKPPEPPAATSDRRATHLEKVFTKMTDKSLATYHKGEPFMGCILSGVYLAL